jgi:hypothetical protein
VDDEALVPASPSSGQGRPPDAYDQLDWQVRRGRLVPAAQLVAATPPWAGARVAHLLEALHRDGYPAQAALVHACWHDPRIVALVVRARRAGYLAGPIVGVALGLFVGLLALLPAVAAVIVVQELALVALRPRRAQSRGVDQSVLRALADVAFFTAPSLKVNRVGATLTGTLGVLAYAAGLQMARLDGPTPASVITSFAGTTVTAAGILAWRGVTRLRRNALDTTVHPPGTRGPATTTVTGPTPTLTHPITILAPRLALIRSLAVTGLLLAGGFALHHDPFGVSLSLAVALGALAFQGRARRSRTIIGPDGVTDVGLWRTRHFPWSSVHALLDHEGTRHGLTLVEAGGRRRQLAVPTTHLTEDDLMVIAELATALAQAPDPGADPSDRRFRLVAIIFLAVVTLFVTAVLLAITLAGPTTRIDPATLPAGHPYTVIVPTNGPRFATIECPAVTNWSLSRDRDPACGDTERTNALAALIGLTIDVALVAAIVALQRSRRRLAATRPS